MRIRINHHKFCYYDCSDADYVRYSFANPIVLEPQTNISGSVIFNMTTDKTAKRTNFWAHYCCYKYIEAVRKQSRMWLSPRH